MPMKLSPELIPHSEFHACAWYLPLERQDWYYYNKQQNRNVIKNADFIDSVDPPLKELVKFLHGKKIKTTPSCAGHHIGEKSFEKIYDDLKKDEKEIRNAGLKVKNIETGKVFLYKDPSYKLPWGKKQFVKEVSIYQQKGVLGIHLRNKKLREKILQGINISKVILVEKESVLFIFTCPKNIQRTWKKITGQVKKLLK